MAVDDFGNTPDVEVEEGTVDSLDLDLACCLTRTLRGGGLSLIERVAGVLLLLPVRFGPAILCRVGFPMVHSPLTTI